MEEKYVALQEAQEILRHSQRQVQYYVSGGKIRSRKAGRRLMLLQEDVQRMADENGAHLKEPPKPTVEMLPDTGPLIDYLREKDSQIVHMARRIGELEAQLEQRLIPEDASVLREELAVAKYRIQELERQAQVQEQIAQAEERQPWWKRLFGASPTSVNIQDDTDQ